MLEFLLNPTEEVSASQGSLLLAKHDQYIQPEAC